MSNKRTCLLAFVLSAVLGLGGCAGQAELTETETNIHVINAESALARGEYLEAAVEYRLAALGTSRLETVRYAAETTFEFGRDEDAAAAINHWAELAPDDRDVIVYQARLALRADEPDAAVANFIRFVELGEDRGDSLDRVSQVLMIDGSPDTALAAALAVSERFADSWKAQRLVSRVAMRADDLNRSMEAA